LLFVDTNIFLEFLLDQEKANEVIAFFLSTEAQGEKMVCSQFSIHAIEAILSSRGRLVGLKNFLKNVERAKNLFVYSTTLEEEREIAETPQGGGLDFDDALQYAVAKKLGCSAIVSFDQDFDNTDLKRKTPKEALKK